MTNGRVTKAPEPSVISSSSADPPKSTEARPHHRVYQYTHVTCSRTDEVQEKVVVVS